MQILVPLAVQLGLAQLLAIVTFCKIRRTRLILGMPMKSRQAQELKLGWWAECKCFDKVNGWEEGKREKRTATLLVLARGRKWHDALTCWRVLAWYAFNYDRLSVLVRAFWVSMISYHDEWRRENEKGNQKTMLCFFCMDFGSFHMIHSFRAKHS